MAALANAPQPIKTPATIAGRKTSGARRGPFDRPMLRSTRCFRPGGDL
jgi:hypothetical protein